MSLISELRRRNVLRMAAGYLAVSWLLLQIVETLLPIFGFSDSVARYIVIALGIGFIPTLAFSWAFEWTPDGLKRDESVTSNEAADFARTQAKTWDRVILVVMAVALGYFAFDRFVLAPEREADLVAAATEAGAEQERSKKSAIVHESVAVLPFANMSADPENEYFSDGLTETLLHMLAQVVDLQVAARTSSFAFKGRNIDIRTIALELGVAHVLEGSVQKAGNRIRVTAQLIRADDGFHVWSQNYDRTLDDVFVIQDEIAKDVADALGSSLLANNENAIVGVFTENVSAYDLYLRALEQQAIGTFKALSAADELFEQALLKDETFVDATFGLVKNIVLKGYTGNGDFEANAAVAAKLIAEVLAANPNDLVARQFELRFLAVAADGDMDLIESDRIADRILQTFEIGPGDPFIRSEASNYLISKDRTDEAIELLRDGLVNDPLNVRLLSAQANLLWTTDGPAAALQPLMTAIEIQPDNPLLLWSLGVLEFGLQRPIEGLQYMRRIELIDPLDLGPTREIAVTLNEFGLSEHTERWMQKVRTREQSPGRMLALELVIAAEIGDEETMRRVVPGAIDAMFKGEYDDFFSVILIREYVSITLDDDKALEGLEYFESFFPGILEMGGDAVTDWETFRVQAAGVLPLMRSLSDNAKNQRDFEALTAKMQERGIDYSEGTNLFIWHQYHSKGFEAGKAAFLSVFDDDLYILAYGWRVLRRARWAEDLLADPDIAAVYAARNAKVAALRERAIEMMKEPEWQ